MLNSESNMGATLRLTPQDADSILSAQFIIAWAGEGGEEKRLGWWRSDMVSQYGGIDLFQRLLPNTWEWATLQAAREAARITDARIAARSQTPDQTYSIFTLGFELDELVEERLQTHKRASAVPTDVLPELKLIGELGSAWNRSKFQEWASGAGKVDYSQAPAGRLVKAPQDSPAKLVRTLVAALLPIADEYPRPHVRR
jgi:hypothetical protein